MQVRRPALICSVLILILASWLPASGKNRDWQTGTLTHVESESRGAAAVPISGLIVAVPISEWEYTIDTESMTYVLARRGPNPLNVTENNHVKFAVDPKNARAFLLDDAGKEFEMSVIRKIAKNPPK